jgi:hypothetical protein
MFIVGFTSLFAVFYVIGVVVALLGTGFLLTFGKQLKLVRLLTPVEAAPMTSAQMLKPTRLTVSAVLVGSIAMTMVSAFVLGLDSLVIVFAVVTYLSYAWLSLSYIPGARALVKKCVCAALLQPCG